MKSKKVLIPVAILALIVFAGITLVATKAYPVAMVNWHSIPQGAFSRNYAAALTYYGKALETYDKNDQALINSDKLTAEVKAAVLEKLVEDSLVEEELDRRFSQPDLDRIVDKKISDALSGENLEKEVEALYGLSLNDFTRLILRPQAMRETLQGQLTLDNKNFDDWLAQAKSKATVEVLISGFSWDGREVVAKQ